MTNQCDPKLRDGKEDRKTLPERYVPLLVWMGLRDLSMNPSVLLEVKQTVRTISVEKTKSVVQKALQLSTAAGVAKLVRRS